MHTQSSNRSSGFADVKGVVAVDAHVPSAGAIVWWRLSGRVDYAALQAAWAAAGLAERELLQPCTNTTALRRAAGSLRERRRLVRPLGRGEGFAIVSEHVVSTTAELEHRVICKVSLNADGRPEIETLPGQDEQGRIAGEIRAAFEAHLSELECEDFSTWLVRMMPRMDAVSLRDTGGVYFIPHCCVARFEEVVKVLHAVTGHTINRVPAMRSDEAVAAILDAVEQEAEQEATRMERDLEVAKLGERGFENRIQQCDEVEAKVTRYEGMLGTKLDTLRARLESLRAQLVVAVMTARRSSVKDG